MVHKIGAGRPDALDMMKNGDIGLVVNTPSNDTRTKKHEKQIRALAVARSIPCFTTIPAAAAAVSAVERLLSDALEVEALQDVLG